VYVVAASQPKLKKTLIIGNPKALVGGQLVLGTLIFSDSPVTIYWIVTGYRGERILRVPSFYNQDDTGLTDGTNSQ
jgi:hypothetical protein